MHGRKYTLYAANLLLYGFTGLYYCFISLYLNKIHSASVAGALLAVAQTVAILAPLFWGACADKARYKRSVLLIIMLGVTVFYSAVCVSNHILWLAIALACTMFFLSSLGSVLDVICMEFASREGCKYGRMRLMGMIGYGFVAFGLSFFIGDDLGKVFKVAAVMGAVCCVCVYFMPKTRQNNKNADGKVISTARKNDFLALLGDKRLLILMLALGCAQFAYGYYLNFFPTYLTEELSAPTFLWGINVLLMTVGEAPFYIFFDVIFARFGIKKTVPFILGATAVRYLLLSFVKSFVGILLIALLSGMLSVAMLYCVQFFVNKNIKPDIRARAQTLVYTLGLGVPRMLSAIIGGMMTERVGTNISLAVCSSVSFFGLLAFLILMGNGLKESGF